MKSLNDLHLEQHAQMGVYNNRSVPSAYHEPLEEYKAVRENALLIDYSHMSIISVFGDYALTLVNYIASADISVVRHNKGAYSLVLFENGTIRGDMYVLPVNGGFYILSENLSVFDMIDCINSVLKNADSYGIHELPEIEFMEEDDWGVIMLEGPYSWEIMADIYGEDVLSLQCYEYFQDHNGLIVLRCCKHGEYTYMVIGPQKILAQLWQTFLSVGERYFLKTGGLNYQNIVRVENTCWDEGIYADFTRNPLELELQWAIQIHKDEFLGKVAAEKILKIKAARKLVGILPLESYTGISPNNNILCNEKIIGPVIKSVYSPGLHSFIALALIDGNYTCASDDHFLIETSAGKVAAKMHSIPFIYNLSWFLHPKVHSFIDGK